MDSARSGRSQRRSGGLAALLPALLVLALAVGGAGSTAAGERSPSGSAPQQGTAEQQDTAERQGDAELQGGADGGEVIDLTVRSGHR